MTTVTTTAPVDPLGLDAALGNVGIVVRDYGNHRVIEAAADPATIEAAVASHTPAVPEPTSEERIAVLEADLAAAKAQAEKAAVIESALVTKGVLTAKDITDAAAVDALDTTDGT